MKRGDYRPGMILDPSQLPRLGTEKDNANLMEFCRLCGEIGARPRMLIRYIRESYFGENDDYARVTIDRRLTYRPTDSWELPADEPGSGSAGARWTPRPDCAATSRATSSN